MNEQKYYKMAAAIVKGHVPTEDQYRDLVLIPENRVFELFPGADIIRTSRFGRKIQLCTICNAKSGRCSEDCSFCSQSAFARTDAPVYPLMTEEEMQKGALLAEKGRINRYSIVTSGKRLPRSEVRSVANAVKQLGGSELGFCASLGILDREDLDLLKGAGVTRYHHNLETSRSHFGSICTTHTYEERVKTINAARDAGLSLCVGGLFGMGETDEQVLELALAIKGLDVDSVPINFLTPIKGTKLQDCSELSPLRCLKIIAIFRYVLPDSDILVCGGREANLKELHPLIFYAGASGIMTGNYLTTKGRTLDQDLEMLDHLALTVRA